MIKITKVTKPEKKKSPRQIRREEYLAMKADLLLKTKNVFEIIEKYFSKKLLSGYSITRWYANIPMSSKNYLGILGFGQEVFSIRKNKNRKIADFALLNASKSGEIDINVIEEEQDLIVNLAKEIEGSMDLIVRVAIYSKKLPLKIGGEVNGVSMFAEEFNDIKPPINGLNNS